MNSPTLVLNPFARIAAAGCDIAVRHADRKFTVRLVRGGEVVATTLAARSGATTSSQAEQRARLGTWRVKSEFFKALQQLADVADTLAPQ